MVEANLLRRVFQTSENVFAAVGVFELFADLLNRQSNYEIVNLLNKLSA
jgi:hypothetical protein